VFLFVEESCIILLHSFLQELGVVRSWELKTYVFFLIFFSLFISIF
jgi:hypothetical protein